jgi:hypothetical protein
MKTLTIASAYKRLLACLSTDGQNNEVNTDGHPRCQADQHERTQAQSLAGRGSVGMQGGESHDEGHRQEQDRELHDGEIRIPDRSAEASAGNEPRRHRRNVGQREPEDDVAAVLTEESVGSRPLGVHAWVSP